MSNVMDKTKSGFDKAKETVKDDAKVVVEKVGDVAHDVAGTVKNASHKVSDAAHHVAGKLEKLVRAPRKYGK